MAGSGDLVGDLCAPLDIGMDLATLERRPGVRVMREDSAETIARDVRMSGAPWVWVEGFVQSGKSSFADRLALALGWQPAIHLDHMTLESDGQPKDSSRYADQLDRARIRVAVTARPVVVEGVCLRDVVGGMRPEAAIRLYVASASRASAHHLIWHDGVELQQPGNVSDNWLVREVMEYHRRVRPHTNSDLLLVGIEDDADPRRE